jgi:hypothetical protein
MLGSNEEINAPGETDYMFDYLKRTEHSDRWTCDVEALRNDRAFQSQNLGILNTEDGSEITRNLADQLSRRAQGRLCLCVHGNVEKVSAIFADSKIVHLIRDPRDVANSCIGMGWAGNIYYGIDQWLETEENWDSFAPKRDPQRVLEIYFEELITNPQAELERVCKFLGVPYSPAMLNYSTRTTYGPPDPSTIQQWKSKLRPREVALVELKTKKLLLSRNYKLSGYPLKPPGVGEKLSLFCANKIFKWKFGLRRYGIANFILEKITRKLLKPFHHVYVERFNKIDKRYLK